MPKGFENPLLSHARMRGLYRGLVELRALEAVPRGLEACWAATAIGLDEDDFAASAAGAYIQTLGTRPGNGSPRKLPPLDRDAATSPLEKALTGVGAAMALENLKGVAVIYLADLRAQDWLRILTLAARLPLILISLPKARVDLQKIARNAGGIPVIPVDAADAVALYRVAQESIVRARADRQPTIVECISSASDPLDLLARQLVAKGICTTAWLRKAEESFATLLAPRRTPRKVH